VTAEIYLIVAALVTTFGLAGWLAGLAAVPQPLDGSTRLLLSLSLGVPATALLGLPGLLAGRLDLQSVGFTGGALAVLALWRSRWAALAFLQRAPGQLRLPKPWSVVGVLAAAAVLWFAVLEPQAASLSDPNLWPSGLALYYWHLVELTVSRGELPATVLEWGATRPFPVEYLTTTLHGAVTSILAGDVSLRLLAIYRVSVVVLLLVAAYALARRWLPAWWAFMATVLAGSSLYLSAKLLAYRPETFALVLVLWSAWLLDQAVERRSPRWALLAGLVLATSFLGHGTAWLVAPALWGGVIVGRWFAGRKRGLRLEAESRPRRRTSVLASAQLPIVAGCAFVLGIAAMSAATGTADRLIPLLSGDEAKRPVQAGQDPTWDFYYLVTYQESGLRPSPPPACGQLLGVRTVRTPWSRSDLSSPLTLGVMAMLVIGPILATRRRQRALLLGAACFVAGLYFTTEALCVVFPTYVPGRAGPQRVLPYYVLGGALLLALGGWLASSLLGDLVGRRGSGGRSAGSGAAVRSLVAGRGAVVLLSAVMLIVLTPIGSSDARPESSGRLSEVSGEAYVWMRDNLPADAVVLPNAFTAGGLGAVTQRNGWLDGRAPYMESPDWLAEATRSLRFAQRYFREPAENRAGFPGRVDYLVVAASGVDLGGRPFVTDYDSLLAEPNLQVVRSFRDAQVVVFRVASPGDDAARQKSPSAREEKTAAWATPSPEG